MSDLTDRLRNHWNWRQANTSALSDKSSMSEAAARIDELEAIVADIQAIEMPDYRLAQRDQWSSLESGWQGAKQTVLTIINAHTHESPKSEKK